MLNTTKNRYKLMLNPDSYTVTCSAYGCDMRGNTNAFSEIKMFLFPKNPYRRRRWELATRRADWKANNRSKLCSKHFITGQPSKDPKHPDYVPSIFVFTENAEDLKKSFSKRQKKLIQEETANHDGTTSHEGTCIASSCGKGFCAKCFSPESVSSAFNMSLAPLNQTLMQLVDKLKDMEEEREQLRSELASCREEIQELREAHQFCEAQPLSTSMNLKPKRSAPAPSTSEEDANELLESMYADESSDADDPDSYPSLCLNQNSFRSAEKSNKRPQTHWNEINSDDVRSIVEQSSLPKKKRGKGSILRPNDTSESSESVKSSDTNSPITIVYLKR